MPRRKPHPVRLKIARYTLPDGARCRADTPGAIRTVELSEAWYAHIDGERVPLETRDEGEAWQRLHAELARRERRRLGITDDYTDHAAADIDGHRDAWIQAVADGGASAEHVAVLSAHLLTLCRLAGWKRLGDITAETCGRALARLQKDGRSAQTRDHYLRHAKQFTRWCCDNDRLTRDPLRSLRRLGTAAVEADRRRVHRMPTDAEMAALFAYLESGAAARNKGDSNRGPAQRLADGRLRALAYKIAMTTGFRANELRNLTREGIDLAAATATVQAGYSKRRRTDVQPLPPWLVAELLAWFGGGGAWERIPTKGGEMLQADLTAAGIEYETAAGEFTLHSLRVYYITKLSHQPGIDPKTLFDLSRHSDPRLTLSTYAKGDDESRRRAVDGIGPPTPTPPPEK